MRHRRAVLALAVAVLAAGAVAAVAATNDDELLKDEKHFLEQSNKTYTGGQKAAQLSNMEVVGKTDIGGRGFNADVWVHEGFAYVGHWGFQDWANGSKTRFCPEPPQSGVAVIDVRVPSSPKLVARLQNPVGTSAEDVVVYTAPLGPLAGRDIAVAGLQWCGGARTDQNADRGVMLWDVTNPASPVQVGYLRTACCTRGVHEFEVASRTDLGRTFVYGTVPTSRYPEAGSPSGYRDVNGDGDFRLFDVTNPASPFQVSDWGIQDAGGPFAAGQGCDADPNYGHGVEPSADGRLAFVSYWDSGFVRLDLTNPASPQFTGRTVYPANADGDAHSAQYDEGRQLLFGADEDFCKTSGPATETGYGYLRVYDYSNPAAPTQVGEYRTPSSAGLGAQGSGDYSLHNNLLVGDRLYQSWYSDGVRVLDVSDETDPEEIAFFVPPAGQNPVKPPQRGTLSQMPQVWGVVVDEATGLVYASDMNSGLWIVRVTD